MGASGPGVTPTQTLPRVSPWVGGRGQSDRPAHTLPSTRCSQTMNLQVTGLDPDGMKLDGPQCFLDQEEAEEAEEAEGRQDRKSVV